MKKYLNKILSYEDLSFDEMKETIEIVMTGKVNFINWITKLMPITTPTTLTLVKTIIL